MNLEFWIPIIVNIFVALGTILLAIFAFISSKQVQKQSEKIEEMQIAQLNLNSPLLRINNFSFKDNKIKVNLTNIGNGVAIDVAVYSHFSQAIFNPSYDESKNKSNKIWGTFSYWPRKLFFENKEVFGNGAITKFKKGNLSAEIAPNETIELEVEPQFFIKFGKTLFSQSQSLTFDKFRQFLKDNLVSFAEIVFELAYKDLSERPLTDRHITRLGHYTKDNTLEKAINRKLNIRVSSISLDEYPDFAISRSMYDNIKTKRTFTSKQKNSFTDYD